MANENMTFSAIPAGDTEPVSVECGCDFGDDIQQAAELHGEDNVMYFFKRGAKSYLGMRGRAQIVGGKSADEVREAVGNADLSKRGREKMSPLEKLLKQADKLPPDDRAALIKSLKG